jgi:hypothetical protein
MITRSCCRSRWCATAAPAIRERPELGEVPHIRTRSRSARACACAPSPQARPAQCRDLRPARGDRGRNAGLRTKHVL